MKPNESASLPAKNRNRNAETTQTPTQAQAQTTGSSAPGELDKYATLLSELSTRVAELSRLHTDRAGYQMEADSLKAERTELEGKILDSVPESGPQLARLVDEEIVTWARLNALSVRIDKAETELHTKFPLALLCFGRLHGYVVACTLASAKESVTKLLAPGYSVPEDVLGQIAIATPAFVFISQLKLPGLTHTVTRPLAYDQPHWSSLVRAYTAAEKAQLRAETVQSLVSATNALCGAAGALLAAAAPYADRCPPFRCEPEPLPPPAQPDPKFLEWQTPLHGSEREVIEAFCRESGRDPDKLSETDARIVADFMAQRRKMPQSHGIVSSPMIGSTVPDFGEPKE